MSENTANKLQIAFLGGAVNSAVGGAHFSAINLNNDYEIVGGCFSRNSDINYASGKQFGIQENRIFRNLDEIISHSSLDAIFILTPTNQHKEQVLQCLEAGIPVVCEKALAMQSKDAMEIFQKVEKTNAFLAVIYNYLGYPMLRELKQMIANGKLGKLQQIHIEMPQEGFLRLNGNGEPNTPKNWRLQDESIPTISLDLGVHLHSIVKQLTGECPLEVVSYGNTFGNFENIIDNVSCMVKYSNDLYCNMWYSKVALGFRNGLKVRIFGSSGSVEWVQENPEHLFFSDKLGNKHVYDRSNPEMEISNLPRYTRFKAGHPAGFIEAFANYYYDIAEALAEYKNDNNAKMNGNCFGALEAVEGLQLFEAIERSMASKTWESVNCL